MISDKIYLRGVLVLQETKFIPLSIWAQRLHDGNNASRGEWGCAVKGWTWGRKGRGRQEGGKGIKEETHEEYKEDDEDQQVGGLSWTENRTMRMKKQRERFCVRVGKVDICQRSHLKGSTAANGQRGSTCRCWISPFIILLHKNGPWYFSSSVRKCWLDELSTRKKKKFLVIAQCFHGYCFLLKLVCECGSRTFIHKNISYCSQAHALSLISCILSTFPFLRKRRNR